VLVGVGVEVFVGVGVNVLVGVDVGVSVGVGVKVGVNVGVKVGVGVFVGVEVNVGVGVKVGVNVGVSVGVNVGVKVAVLVAVGVAVGKSTVVVTDALLFVSSNSSTSPSGSTCAVFPTLIGIVVLMKPVAVTVIRSPGFTVPSAQSSVPPVLEFRIWHVPCVVPNDV
jgi:hypothetical protein